MRLFQNNAIKICFVSHRNRYYDNLKSICRKEYPHNRIGFHFIPEDTSLESIVDDILRLELDILIIEAKENTTKLNKLLNFTKKIYLDKKVVTTVILDNKNDLNARSIIEQGADLVYYQNQDYESVLFNSIFCCKPRFVDRSRFALAILKEPYFKSAFVPFKIKYFGPTTMVTSSDIKIKDGIYRANGELFSNRIIGHNEVKIAKSSKQELSFYNNTYCTGIKHIRPVIKSNGESIKSLLLKKRYREEEEKIQIEKCKEKIKNLPINNTKYRVNCLILSEKFNFKSSKNTFISDYDLSFSNNVNSFREYLKRNRPEIIYIQLSDRDFISNKKIREEDIREVINEINIYSNYKPILMIYNTEKDSEYFRVDLNYRRIFSCNRVISKRDIKVFIDGFTKAMKKEETLSIEKDNTDNLASPSGSESWSNFYIEDDIRVHGMSENYLVFSTDNEYPVGSNFEMSLCGLVVAVKVIDFSLNKSGKMQIALFHGVDEAGKEHLRRLAQEAYFLSKNPKKRAC